MWNASQVWNITHLFGDDSARKDEIIYGASEGLDPKPKKDQTLFDVVLHSSPDAVRPGTPFFLATEIVPDVLRRNGWRRHFAHDAYAKALEEGDLENAARIYGKREDFVSTAVDRWVEDRIDRGTIRLAPAIALGLRKKIQKERPHWGAYSIPFLTRIICDQDQESWKKVTGDSPHMFGILDKYYRSGRDLLDENPASRIIFYWLLDRHLQYQPLSQGEVWVSPPKKSTKRDIVMMARHEGGHGLRLNNRLLDIPNSAITVRHDYPLIVAGSGHEPFPEVPEPLQGSKLSPKPINWEYVKSQICPIGEMSPTGVSATNMRRMFEKIELQDQPSINAAAITLYSLLQIKMPGKSK